MVWLLISGLIVFISYLFINSFSKEGELKGDLPREKQFIEEVNSSKTLETKDTVVGKRYVREGKTKNYYFKVVKTYEMTSITVSGEFIKKDALLNQVKTYQGQPLSQTSLDRILSKLQKKESWDKEKTLEMEVSPMGPTANVPIVPKKAY